MSRTPKLAAVAVLAAFSGLALQVQAQETVELDEVKVTAGRVEQELMDVNMSVSVITQEEIRRSSARNVGELLEDIPGCLSHPRDDRWAEGIGTQVHVGLADAD